MDKWYLPYLGLPYAPAGRAATLDEAERTGIDCWGLVLLVFRLEHQLTLDPFAGLYDGAGDLAGIKGPMATRHRAPWRGVPEQTVRAMDVAVLSLAGQPRHVGLIALPGYILHTDQKRGVVLEHLFESSRWAARPREYFRHQLLLTRETA